MPPASGCSSMPVTVAAGHARGEAETHGAHTRTEIEHVDRPELHVGGGGQQHRVHRDSISASMAARARTLPPITVHFRSARIPCYSSSHDFDVSVIRLHRSSLWPPVMATVVSLEGKRKSPSLEPLLALCTDDMARVDREIVAAHALAGRADSRARQPSRRRRRQADASASHGRVGAAVRLQRGRRRPPHQARDLRRVHPFRHVCCTTMSST